MRRVWGVLLGLAVLPLARAAPPQIALTEISYLLEFVGKSGCEFFRNGSWYDSKSAQAHLRYKYDLLAARDQIRTAEDFIEKGATQSSMSGRPYEVRCGSGESIATNQWLRDELVRYRAYGAYGAPRVTRGALGIYASGSNESSVVLLDLDVATDILHAFGLACNGYGLVCRFLGPGAAVQPHHAVLVRIDMNAPQAGQMFRSEPGLDFHRDGRVLHEGLRV
jgi:hypothetical protein